MDARGTLNDQGVYFMTIAILPMLREAESPNVTVIASIAGLANQRYVPVSPLSSTDCLSSSVSSFLVFLSHPFPHFLQTFISSHHYWPLPLLSPLSANSVPLLVPVLCSVAQSSFRLVSVVLVIHLRLALTPFTRFEHILRGLLSICPRVAPNSHW